MIYIKNLGLYTLLVTDQSGWESFLTRKKEDATTFPSKEKAGEYVSLLRERYTTDNYEVVDE